MTPAEQVRWQAIRRQQVAGTRFRRQHPLGLFILDFCYPEHRLVIEVDGPIHDAQDDYDTTRTLHLEGYRYRVLRFKNEEVLHELDSVVTRIAKAFTPTATSSPPSPRPPTGRGPGG